MSEVTLTVTDPIYINTVAGTPNTDILLTVQQPYYIGVVGSDVIQVETDPVFQGWIDTTPPAYPEDIPTLTSDLTNDSGFTVIGFGDKSSATDAGALKEVSLGDDYIYFCTIAGTAGNATWKKAPLFKAN